MHRTLALLLALSGPAVAQGTPVGQWLTEGRDAVITVAPCGAALCGRITGITLDRPDDPIPTDYQGSIRKCGANRSSAIARDATVHLARSLAPHTS